jgi:hypothetical protein
MPKPPQLWFKPNTDECPSCFLVLNQLPCYFRKGTTQELLDSKYPPHNIPRNSTLRHRLLDQDVYNDTTLPSNILDAKLIRSLRKRPDLLTSTRSERLDYYVPEHRARAFKRAERQAGSELPLGLLISSEKPSLEERLLNALSAFTDRLDQPAPIGVATITPTVAPNSFQAIENSRDELIQIRSTLELMTSNERSNSTDSKSLTQLRTKMEASLLNINTKLNELKLEHDEMHRSTQNLIAEKFSQLESLINALQASTTATATTPRPTVSHHAHNGRHDNKSETEIPPVTRLPSPAYSPAHSRTASLTETQPPRYELPISKRDELYTRPSLTRSQASSLDQDPDSDSNESENSAVTTVTTTTMASDKSLKPVDRTTSTDRNVWSCSTANLDNWVSYLYETSHSFKSAYHSKDESTTLAATLYDKYIHTDKAAPDFTHKVKEELASEIRHARKKRQSNSHKHKSSRTDTKPSSIWPSRKK